MEPRGDRKDGANSQQNTAGLSKDEIDSAEGISKEFRGEQAAQQAGSNQPPTARNASGREPSSGGRSQGQSRSPSGGGASPRGASTSTPTGRAASHSSSSRSGSSSGHSASQLKSAEEGGASTAIRSAANTGRAAGLATAEKDGAKSLFTGGGGDSGGGGLGKAQNFIKKHRKKIIAGGLAGVGVMPMLIFLLFILLALKFPHFVEQVAAWRFAKVTREYRQSMTNVMGEKNGYDALDDASKKEATAKYGKYQTFDKVNRLRPNKVIASLETSDRIQYNYKTTPWGNQQLTSIIIADGDNLSKRTIVNVPSGKFAGVQRILNPIKTLNQNKAIAEALNAAMKAHDPKIPGVVRAAATKAVIKKTGGSLKGLIAAHYVGKSDREAKIAIQQDFYDEVNDRGGVGAASSDNLRELEADVIEAEDACVQDVECIGESVDEGGGTPKPVADVIEKGLNPGSAKAIASKVVGFANPLYDIAVPVCMVYDGSKVTADGVDAQSNATQREALLALSASDQQRDGVDFTKEGSNALNWKIGDIQNTNAVRRVSNKPVDTTNGIGGQRSILGQYGKATIFDVMFGPGNPFNASADAVCPVLTNIWVGVGIGVVNLAVVTVTSIFSGGATAVGEQAVAQTARAAATAQMKHYATKLIADFTVKRAAGATARFAKAFGTDVAKWSVGTAAATLLARLIVMAQAGSLNNGLETGATFGDNIDNGADQLSSNMMRANFYARPCNNVEVIQNQQLDRAEVAMYNGSMGTFDRYLALSNPNSLTSRMAITTGSLMERSSLATAINSSANLLNPLSLTSRIFSSSNGQAAFAASAKNTQDYGNVQFCYSANEQRLMQQQDSYASPSENALQLEESGKESEIEQKYGKCFNIEVTIGQLLENGDVQRDEEGDVLNDGDCSPQNLSYNNPDYGDLVFRYRLKHNYENTTDTLLGIQDPAAFSVTQTQGSTGSVPTGTAQQLATQIINNPNITFQTPEGRTAMEYIAQTGKPRTCGAPAISTKLLGVLLAAASKYKIVIGVVVDGHNCVNPSGAIDHGKGISADLNGVNPLSGPGGTGNQIRWSSDELPILKNFYQDVGQLIAQAGGGGLGQVQCFGGKNDVPPQINGVNYFSDACTHLHITVNP